MIAFFYRKQFIIVLFTAESCCKVSFTITVMMVPGTLSPSQKAESGVTKKMTPATPPSHAPARGPHRVAPITTGIRVSEIDARLPILMNPP